MEFDRFTLRVANHFWLFWTRFSDTDTLRQTTPKTEHMWSFNSNSRMLPGNVLSLTLNSLWFSLTIVLSVKYFLTQQVPLQFGNTLDILDRDIWKLALVEAHICPQGSHIHPHFVLVAVFLYQ